MNGPRPYLLIASASSGRVIDKVRERPTPGKPDHAVLQVSRAVYQHCKVGDQVGESDLAPFSQTIWWHMRREFASEAKAP